MPLIVDASVAVAWFVRNQATSYTNRIRREARKERLHVPAVWPLEFANALRPLERRELLSEQQVDILEAPRRAAILILLFNSPASKAIERRFRVSDPRRLVTRSEFAVMRATRRSIARAYRFRKRCTFGQRVQTGSDPLLPLSKTRLRRRSAYRPTRFRYALSNSFRESSKWTKSFGAGTPAR